MSVLKGYYGSNRLVCRKPKQGLGDAKNEVAVELEHLSRVVKSEVIINSEVVSISDGENQLIC